jgi:cell division protease FtsH
MDNGLKVSDDGDFIPTSCNRSIPYYQYEFIKSYLYRIQAKKTSHPHFQVIRMTGLSDEYFYKPKLVSIAIEDDTGFLRVSDNYLTATLLFNERLYDLSMFFERIDLREFEFTIYTLGLEKRAIHSVDLIKFLCNRAVAESPYTNGMIDVIPDRFPNHLSPREIYIRPAVLESDRLEDIYLPANIRSHIELFVRTLTENQTARKPLRYLFAGKPGTAKTKIIRAIANECKGKATFIFTNGNERRIESLFSFLEIFSPVVLCIDDLDFMTGARDKGLYTPQLAEFLQKLDGFVNRNFFLLATTNDKQLVDLAASRPGRFDLILDVNAIEPRHYLSLVKSKTKSPTIISLFDEDILLSFKRKRVTGAFITNLVKHLELVARFHPEKVNQGYLTRMIEESYRGFYEEPRPIGGDLGFHQDRSELIQDENKQDGEEDILD